MKLTGDLIEAYHRGYLNVEYLNEWAITLIEKGYESKEVIIAASCPNLSWQEINNYFKMILKELNIADNLDNNIEQLKQKIFIDEYKAGLRPGGQLLRMFDNLRKEIGFYDMVGLTILGDDYKGDCKSGYHTLDRKLYGDDLEKEIRRYLEKAGKI